MNPLAKITELFSKPKLIVVLGATSTGKSDIAVEIAKLISGEIISADSRQVYRGLDIGSGKITQEEMAGIPHYLLDIANPNEIFTVANFKEEAEKAIKEILNKKKIPILCGGTGFYIQSIIDNIDFPAVAPNIQFRADLEKFTNEELFAQLQKKDPKRAEGIDSKNRMRLIRALEITQALGKTPKLKISMPYDTLIIGLYLPTAILQEKIYRRLISRLESGMVDEILGLIQSGIKVERLYSLGLEYRYVTEYAVGKMEYDDMVKTLFTKIVQFAKRQMTWFRRDKRIIWLNPTEDKEKIMELAREFVS